MCIRLSETLLVSFPGFLLVDRNRCSQLVIFFTQLGKSPN